MQARFVATLGMAHHFDDLGAPALAEEAGGLGQIGFGRRRVDVDMLRRIVDGQDMQGADGEAGMAAAQAHRHAVRFRELEIAVDLPHHVEEELVGRIAAMHRAADFRRRERPEIAAVVVELAVVLFQPVLELEADQAAVGLVAGHVGDRADAEKRIGGALRRPTGGRQNAGFAFRLEAFHQFLMQDDLPILREFSGGSGGTSRSKTSCFAGSAAEGVPAWNELKWEQRANLNQQWSMTVPHNIQRFESLGRVLR